MAFYQDLSDNEYNLIKLLTKTASPAVSRQNGHKIRTEAPMKRK